MDPFRPMVIDNRAPAPVFLEGSPTTDGMANLFASLINAPIAAGQVRRQREKDDRQLMLQNRGLARQDQMDERQVAAQQQAMQRQAMMDDRAVQWHNQEQATRGRDAGLQVARQNRQDAMAAVFQRAQMKNLDQDNARQMAEMFGGGINNAASRGIDAYKALFGRGGSAAGAGVKPEKPEVRNFGPEAAPDWRQWNGSAWKPVDMDLRSSTDAMKVLRQTNPQLAEVMLGGARQGNPPPWATAGPSAQTQAPQPMPPAASPIASSAPGAPPVEPEFIRQHAARLTGLPAGQARQDYLRRLKSANPALYQAVVQSLIPTAAR